LSETFVILRIQLDVIINVHRYTSRVHYYCLILVKLEVYRQIFEKSTYTKFYENPSSGSRVIPFGRTDGRTGMANLTVAFRNFAKAPRNCLKPYAAGSYKILTNFQGYDYISKSVRASSDGIKNSVTVYTKRLENSPVSLLTYSRKKKTLKSVRSKIEVLDSGLVCLCRCSFIEKRYTRIC